jgi:hypothetical protein
MYPVHKGRQLRIVFFDATVLDNAVLHVGNERG